MSPRLLPLLLLPALTACPAKDDTGPADDTGESGETAETAETGDTEGTDDTADTGETGADTQETGDTATEGAVALGGGLGVWDDGASVEAGSVCWKVGDGERCTKTTRRGTWSIEEVPQGTDGVLWFEDDAIVPSLIPLVTGADDVHIDFYFESQALHDDFYAAAGVADSASVATIAVLVARTGTASSEGAIIGLTGGGSFEGPFYIDQTGMAIDPSLTEATAAGIAYFLAVDPDGGPWTVTVENDGVACDTPMFGARVPSFEAPAGTTVNIAFACE